MECLELVYKKPKRYKLNRLRRWDQEQLDAQIRLIKTRLISNNGYNEQSATDVLNHVASIFARGEG